MKYIIFISVILVLFFASCKERELTQKDYDQIANIVEETINGDSSAVDTNALYPITNESQDAEFTEFAMRTSSGLITYTDTPFTTLVIPFLGKSKVNPLWYYGDNRGQPGTTDLVALLKSQFSQFKYSKLYKRNNASCVIVDGTESSTIQWYRFWSRDSTGLKHALASYPRSLYLYGALSYPEALEQASKRFNVNSFHNRGEETWTQPQRDNFNRTVMHYKQNMKGGNRADFRFPSHQVKQSIIDSAFIFQWTTVLQ